MLASTRRTGSEIQADPQVVLYSPYPLTPGGGERVLFELASHFSNLFGKAHVAIATPHRYSTTRLRQIAGTFGFDRIVGTPVPWAEIEPENCQFSVVLGNTILPPTHAFGDYSVYQLQFPFWVPEQEIAERGSWLGEFDEIWVYSEFVRRHVNGLVRHYGLACTRHPGDHSTRSVAGRHGRPALERAPDDPVGGPVLRRRPQQAPGRRHRGVPPDGRGRNRRSGARPGRRHPSEPRRTGPLLRVAGARRRPTLHPLPQHRSRRSGHPLRTLCGVDPRGRFRRRPRRVPRSPGALRDHAD